MAVDVTPQRTYYRLNTGLTLPFTVGVWIRPDSTPVEYRTIFVHGGNSYGSFAGIYRNAAGRLAISGGVGIDKALSDPLSNGIWYYVGVVVATGTNNYQLFWRAAGETVLHSAAGTRDGGFVNEQLVWFGGPHSVNLGLGENAAHCWDGGGRFGRVFPGALIPAQLLAESSSATPIQPTYGDWRFADAATVTADSSGAGNNLTAAGTGSVAADTDPNISIGSTVSLTPAQISLAAVPLAAIPGAVSVELAPAAIGLEAAALDPEPGPVTVNLTPAQLSLGAAPLLAEPGPVQVALTPAALSLAAVPLVGQPGAVSVALTPAAVDLAAVPLAPSAGGPVTVELVPAELALAAVPLGVGADPSGSPLRINDGTQWAGTSLSVRVNTGSGWT